MPAIILHGREWKIAIPTNFELKNIEMMSQGFINKKDMF